VLCAAFSSSFASVYFERVLKARTRDGASVAPATSLWHRNMQLCAWTVPMNLLLAALQGDVAKTLADPLRGFELSTWCVIVVNGIGGLLVAVVIKYADNIWKGFATAGAIILTGTLAPALGLGPPPNRLLVVGTGCVVGSLVLYSSAPLARPKNPLSEPLVQTQCAKNTE